MLSLAEANRERPVEGLSIQKLERIADQDPSLEQVPQHLGVRVRDAHEPTACTELDVVETARLLDVKLQFRAGDRVSVRVAYRYLSQRGRRVQTEVLVDDEAAPSFEGPGARRQMARDGVKRLYAVLDELSAASRLAFTLHEIDGRTLAETAALVGSTVTATKLRVWRARKKIETAAANDPVLSEFLEPRGADVIPFDDSKEAP